MRSYKRFWVWLNSLTLWSIKYFCLLIDSFASCFLLWRRQELWQRTFTGLEYLLQTTLLQSIQLSCLFLQREISRYNWLGFQLLVGLLYSFDRGCVAFDCGGCIDMVVCRSNYGLSLLTFRILAHWRVVSSVCYVSGFSLFSFVLSNWCWQPVECLFLRLLF